MTMIEGFTSTSSFLQWTLHDHDRRIYIYLFLKKRRGRCKSFYHGHGGSTVKRKR
jgi:hypothetical protein